MNIPLTSSKPDFDVRHGNYHELELIHKIAKSMQYNPNALEMDRGTGYPKHGFFVSQMTLEQYEEAFKYTDKDIKKRSHETFEIGYIE
jgi:hypothetical protein